MSAPAFEPVPAVLAASHTLLEGPCVTPAGIAYSDVLAGGVYLVAGDGTRRTLLERRRGIGGLALARAGGVLLTGRDVALLRSDGGLRTVYADATASGFNDLAVLDDASVAVGVLRYAPMAGEPPVPGEVVRLRGDGAVEVVIDDLLWPNGIAQASDGALLVCDFARAHVKRVDPDGTVRVLHQVADGSCDGCALDAEGALWVATGHGGGLHRVGPDGGLLAEVAVPAAFVSSVCFDGDRLYVTTADSPRRPDLGGALLCAQVDVPGAPLVAAAVP